MDYDNLKINNGALIAWACVIHKTLLADDLPPQTVIFFNNIGKGRNTQTENTYGCDLQKYLIFQYLEINHKYLQNHFNTDINSKNLIRFFLFQLSFFLL